MYLGPTLRSLTSWSSEFAWGTGSVARAEARSLLLRARNDGDLLWVWLVYLMLRLVLIGHLAQTFRVALSPEKFIIKMVLPYPPQDFVRG